MAFGRLERTPGAQPMSDINMTPLIDVMLVLLVIFMITAPLMTSSLKLDLPRTDAAQPTDTPSFVSVAIPAVLAYNIYGKLVGACEAELEGFAHDLREMVAGPSADEA